MNTTKALTDEQIAEVRERYANGESVSSLAEGFHVCTKTVRSYIKGAKPTKASESDEDILDFIYNVARGFGVFAQKHLVGEFSIRVIKERDSTVITAACGDKEIMIKSVCGKGTKT